MDLNEIYLEENTAKRMTAAAAGFLASLDTGQRARAQLDFGDTAERENWHYIPRARAGLALKDMDPGNREHAFALVATGLSPAARAKVETIIALEEILGEMEGPDRRFARDPELYYLSIFGTPGAELWGWRFEGHHVSLNFTLVEGRMIGPMPIFFGANPARVLHGEKEGMRALKEEEDLGRELVQALDGEQKRSAIISSEAPADIITRNLPHVRDEIENKGLSGTQMSPAQRQLLKALVEVYIGRLPAEVAAAEMGKLERTDLGESCFAWAGTEERGGAHYYRIQGPTFLAEYDNTQNDANHIHAVWRDLENDFGEDLLRRHYRQNH